MVRGWSLRSCRDVELGKDGGCGAEYDTALGAEGGTIDKK